MNQSRFPLRLVALFPHEDAARPLRSYRRDLLAAGLSGARSFPLCAPLAVLDRPLAQDELATLAEEIRSCALRADERGRISAAAPVSLADGGLPPRLALPLSLSTPQTFPSGAALSLCGQPALVLALLSDGEEALGSLDYPFAAGDPLSFRAAYIANIVVAPTESGDPRFSFEWEIGKPRWLPGDRE